jgi:hypothetical protein
MNGTEVGVFEESDHVGFGGFLEGKDGGGLESEVVLEFRSNFSDESLERKLSDEELCGFLVFPDFSECDGTWSESVWFLDSTGGGGSGLSGGTLGSNMLSWSFTSGILSCGLFGSCHCILKINCLILFQIQCFIWGNCRISNLIG